MLRQTLMLILLSCLADSIYLNNRRGQGVSIGRGKGISIGRGTDRGGGAKRKSERRKSGLTVDGVGESGLKKGGKIDVSVAVVLPHSIYKAREYNKQIFKASASLSSVRKKLGVVVHYYQG